MQLKISLSLTPEVAGDYSAVLQHIAQELGATADSVTGFTILKKSLDARGKNILIHLALIAFVNERFVHRGLLEPVFPNVAFSKKTIVIIGAGPAGLFAALALIEAGIKPIILERGKDVRERRRDLALLNQKGIVNRESNYCFGEGGAGTYSDGKLYTRSSKRGNIERILNLFVHFGAEEKILYEAHPHIGTNKLPQIITSMRKRIIDCGGEFHFNKKVTDLNIYNGVVKSALTSDGDAISAAAFILATGHSAREIFGLLHRKKITILPKPFALGVRIEHPQDIINKIQYGKLYASGRYGDGLLPPASYSLVEQVDGRGVFSFCMCPGGVIAPAATNPAELVVNGWSPSKRNNPFANSGMVVQVEMTDAKQYLQSLPNSCDSRESDHPLSMVEFQKAVEETTFIAGGGAFVAPAQRMVDFCNNKASTTLPKCSYIPGINSVT
ncbi:MAG: FAD-dependent protein, partial [Ginsengibacter sp.]